MRRLILLLAAAAFAWLIALRNEDAPFHPSPQARNTIAESSVTQEEAAPPVRPARRLVYGDGSPAAGIALDLAIARPIHTRIYRNGDHPEQVVWLVARLLFTRTDAQGWFEFEKVRARAGFERVLFTEADSEAIVLQQDDESEREVVALRRVPVRGRLVSDGGRPLAHIRVAVQQVPPEDWQTRFSKERDRFVHATRGDLEVDPSAKQETLTGPDGRFELHAAPGPNYLVFQDSRIPILAAGPGTDLGNVRPEPPSPPAPRVLRTIHGVVVDGRGEPYPGAQVLVWDGTVGEATGETKTDEEGRFVFRGLESRRIIVWAVSTERRRHVICPEQCSGTVLLPCNTPVVVRLLRPEQYAWTRLPEKGFALFERDGLLLGGDVLMLRQRVGLAPGRYRIWMLTEDGRVLKSRFPITAAGKLDIARDLLRDISGE